MTSLSPCSPAPRSGQLSGIPPLLLLTRHSRYNSPTGPMAGYKDLRRSSGQEHKPMDQGRAWQREGSGLDDASHTLLSPDLPRRLTLEARSGDSGGFRAGPEQGGGALRRPGSLEDTGGDRAATIRHICHAWCINSILAALSHNPESPVPTVEGRGLRNWSHSPESTPMCSEGSRLRTWANPAPQKSPRLGGSRPRSPREREVSERLKRQKGASCTNGAPGIILHSRLVGCG